MHGSRKGRVSEHEKPTPTRLKAADPPLRGIAPLKDETDEAGNFLFEKVLFWVRYPDCREYFSRHRAFMEGNDANPMSWEDLFEMRRFSSYVYKESNVQNRRLQDYLQGIVERRKKAGIWSIFLQQRMQNGRQFQQ